MERVINNALNNLELIAEEEGNQRSKDLQQIISNYQRSSVLMNSTEITEEERIPEKVGGRATQTY